MPLYASESDRSSLAWCTSSGTSLSCEYIVLPFDRIFIWGGGGVRYVVVREHKRVQVHPPEETLGDVVDHVAPRRQLFQLDKVGQLGGQTVDLSRSNQAFSHDRWCLPGCWRA